MGLQDMVRWLLPREDKFYGLIERQGVLLDEAAKALAELAGPALPAEVHEKVREIEHRADAIVYEIEEQLAAVFVTPIDREDIQLLASALDDIIDYINLTARTFVLFAVPRPSKPMSELIQLIVKMAAVLKDELPALRKHEYQKLIAAGRVLKQHEKEGDRIFRNAISELFHDEKIDAKVLLRDKEVLEDLEGAIDRFETVAEVLKHLAVKHG